jgi:hypothetical protein
MPRRPALPILLSLLVAGVVSACGGSSTPSGNGVAAKSPDAIVSAATKAVAGLNTMHISGSVVSGGTPISLDLALVSGKGATGSMSENGLSFKLINVGKFVYINGSPGFWRHFGGSAAAQLFQGKWLKAPSTTGDFASLSSLTNLHKLLGSLLSNHGPLKKGDTSTVNGQKVVGVKDSTKGGTLYVATTGKPYPVELVKTGTDGGKVVFDRLNASVSLAAPPNSINISQLQK